jgi:hypothetical protein
MIIKTKVAATIACHFIFGRTGTVTLPQVCFYSGQIGALRRIKRTLPSVIS